MNIIDTIIISIIEGITEFLPISSTGHMIVASKFLNINQTTQNIAFEIFIQLGATLAIVLLYLDKLKLKNLELLKKVIIAFFPLAIIGFLIKDYVKLLFSTKIVAIMFIIGGIAFILIEKYHKTKKSLKDITIKDALIIGLFQALALIPGTSRSGSTIFGGMIVGLDRKSAADFSFLLAIPTMLAASLYQLLKVDLKEVSVTFLIGFIISFVSAYISVKWFLNFISKFSLIPFGIYRIIFGLLLILYFS